jgi:hypothetical protein
MILVLKTWCGSSDYPEDSWEENEKVVKISKRSITEDEIYKAYQGMITQKINEHVASEGLDVQDGSPKWHKLYTKMTKHHRFLEWLMETYKGKELKYIDVNI